MEDKINEDEGSAVSVGDVVDFVAEDLDEGIEDKIDDFTKNVKDKLVDMVNARAKDVVSRGIDYSLLIALLIVQFMRCGFKAGALQGPDDTIESVSTSVSTSVSNSIDIDDVKDLYSCNFTLEREKLLYTYIPSWLCLLYGICGPIFVWIHAARKFTRLEHVKTTTIEKIYECTDKIIILDTFLEIPISFFFAPIWTVVAWTLFAAICFTLFILAKRYNDLEDTDSTSATTFYVSCLLVILSLIKYTGEISQYWVVYKAVLSGGNKMKKFESVKKFKSKRNFKA